MMKNYCLRKSTFYFTFLLFFLAQYFSAATYYSKSNGNAATLSTWTTNANGTGANPINFSTAGDIFVLQSSSILTLNNNNTDWIIGSGVTLQIHGFLSLNGNKIDVDVKGTVTFTNPNTTQVSLGGNGQGSSFTISSGAVVKTMNINGIYGANCSLPLSVSLGTVTLSNSATYEFIGSLPQMTLGMPSSASTILNVNNAAGVTLSNAASVASLILTKGVLTTDVSKLLSIESTSTGAVSGGSATSYINGPVRLTLPENLNSDRTYVFPVGKGNRYLPFSLVNPRTGSGTVTAQLEAFAANSGGTPDGTALGELSTAEYWSLATAGNFTSSAVSISRPNAISPFDRIAGSTTLNGTYGSLAGTVGTNSITSSSAIGTNRFFTFGRKKQKIATGTIAGSPFCAGSTVTVPFTIEGTFDAGNNFIAQLSDASGSFSNPVNIGTLSQRTAGIINAIIPANTPAGTDYRIRVVGSHPIVVGNTSDKIKVNSSPVATVTSSGRICQGADAIFTITGTPGAEITYTINGGSLSTVNLTDGSITVTTPSVSIDQNLKIIKISKGNCTVSADVSAAVTVGAESVYTDSTGWSNGLPSDNGLNAVIAGKYDTASGNISTCNCTVQPGGVLTVSKGTVLKIENILVNHGTLTVESDGNLIQVNDGAINSGNILVKRDLVFKNDKRNEYNYLISPVEDANLKTQMYRKADGTPVVAPFVLYHNEVNNFFYNSSGAYIKGRSLAVKEPSLSSGALPTAFFEGKPVNGIINYSLAYSGKNLGFNLVGNPYPSNLDLNLLYAQNKKEIESTFRFWDNSVNELYVQQGSAYKGNAYAMRNEAAGTSGTGLPAPGNNKTDKGNSKKPDRIVKIGQGFMVRASEAGKVLKYDNTLRSADNKDSVFFGKAVQDDRYWLQLKAPSGITSTIAVVYFAKGNSAFGADDSRTMGGSDVLYSFAENEKVAINGRTSFTIEDKINLGSSHFVKGDYTIALGDLEGVFANGQKIFLKDGLTGTVTNLSEGDYTFTAGAGESTGRFEIIYKAETVLAVDSQIAEELIIYRDGGDFVVKAQSKKITGLELYDTAGRLIYKSNPNSLQAVISGEMLNSGMYVLKTDQNGIVTAKKIIK